MKRFYLLRHQDVHGNSGTGIVAEGVFFDNGLSALTWLSGELTITSFVTPRSIKKLHGHGGSTEIIIEGKDLRFEELRVKLRLEKRNQHVKKRINSQGKSKQKEKGK